MSEVQRTYKLEIICKETKLNSGMGKKFRLTVTLVLLVTFGVPYQINIITNCSKVSFS